MKIHNTANKALKKKFNSTENSNDAPVMKSSKSGLWYILWDIKLGSSINAFKAKKNNNNKRKEKKRKLQVKKKTLERYQSQCTSKFRQANSANKLFRQLWKFKHRMDICVY